MGTYIDLALNFVYMFASMAMMCLVVWPTYGVFSAVKVYVQKTLHIVNHKINHNKTFE